MTARATEGRCCDRPARLYDMFRPFCMPRCAWTSPLASPTKPAPRIMQPHAVMRLPPSHTASAAVSVGAQQANNPMRHEEYILCRYRSQTGWRFRIAWKRRRGKTATIRRHPAAAAATWLFDGGACRLRMRDMKQNWWSLWPAALNHDGNARWQHAPRRPGRPFTHRSNPNL